MRKFVLLLAAGTALISLTTNCWAGNRWGTGCCPNVASADTELTYVERTVMVPTVAMESRTINVVEFREEARTRVVPVHRRIPETKTVTEEVTISEPQWRTRQEPCRIRIPITREVTREVIVKRPVWSEVVRDRLVQVPMWKEVEQRCMVMVPHQEVHEGCTVTVCRPDWITRTLRVCEMRTEKRTYTQRVCQYIPERRTQTLRVPDCEFRTEVRDVKFVVMVPKTINRTRNVTTYRTVVEERTENFVVRIPVSTQKEVVVPVCHLVPKTIKVCCSPCCR